MTKYTFSPKNFEAFDVDGLDARMEALNEHVRPQLHQLESISLNTLQLKQVKLLSSRGKTC